jgi:transposase-like protein
MYQVEVSPDLISRVTDAVADELAEWQARPLDAVWPVIFIDALVRHEAPCIRVEVGDLRRRVVAAA